MIKRKFKNILVVVGGNSGEREISLASGKACIKALRKKITMFRYLTQSLKI